MRCGLQGQESRGLVDTKQESQGKISRFCRKVALSDRKVGVELGVFAPKFHTQKPNQGPKILRDSELGFWGCAKRLALLEAQPPPPYAPLRLSDFPQAEYVKTLYRLPCVGALAMVLGHQRSGAHIQQKGGCRCSPQGQRVFGSCVFQFIVSISFPARGNYNIARPL